MAIPERIFLVGPMGAGKTTIGVKLADRLNKRFIDSDREIENKTGANIPLIFELEGEEGFRRREAEALSELSQLPDIVLATGGGAILREENRQAMMSNGFVIYLRAPIEQLLNRTAKDKNRPLLQTANPRKVLTEILKKREPFYQEVANLVVETNKKSIREIIDQIMDILNA